MNLPDLHDWEIKAILTDHNVQSVIIQLLFPETDETASITLKGVTHFQASEMMLQNVILDVLVFKSVVESDYFEHCKKVLDIRNDFFSENNNVKILYVEPSVGVELACSFTEIEFNSNK
ncbi:MAG: hypothetical protein DRR16_27710 [Candidatus Parabeggiatoa sp. nov. 3]|nr:MAG: hypothetical protein DRR00_23865 [Gammaproteobacteria bacterium]RKZ61442.1 MAG: hypothetical protein DRQ99_20455 [Gammaproteobacteria bacterium]RKZ78432.1 MAG: hypothetical protein DRR16_27710 [Gammaproteobacteria bacterium]HEW97547.1 hypothetical protein [Beggiatoa sp.]